MLGNIKFIGELGKLEMVQEGILHECIQQLITRKSKYPKKTSSTESSQKNIKIQGGKCQTDCKGCPSPDDLECLCQILKTVGKRLDHPKAQSWMDQYFQRIKYIQSQPLLPPRIKFMLQDIVEMRENNWQPRHFNLADGAPRTIQQVRGESGLFEPKMPTQTNLSPSSLLSTPFFSHPLPQPPPTKSFLNFGGDYFGLGLNRGLKTGGSGSSSMEKNIGLDLSKSTNNCISPSTSLEKETKEKNDDSSNHYLAPVDDSKAAQNRSLPKKSFYSDAAYSTNSYNGPSSNYSSHLHDDVKSENNWRDNMKKSNQTSWKGSEKNEEKEDNFVGKNKAYPSLRLESLDHAQFQMDRGEKYERNYKRDTDDYDARGHYKDTKDLSRNFVGESHNHFYNKDNYGNYGNKKTTTQGRELPPRFRKQHGSNMESFPSKNLHGPKPPSPNFPHKISSQHDDKTGGKHASNFHHKHPSSGHIFPQKTTANIVYRPPHPKNSPQESSGHVQRSNESYHQSQMFTPNSSYYNHHYQPPSSSFHHPPHSLRPQLHKVADKGEISLRPNNTLFTPYNAEAIRQSANSSLSSQPFSQPSIFPKLDVKDPGCVNKSKAKMTAKPSWIEVKGLFTDENFTEAISYIQNQCKNNKYIVDLLTNLMLDALENSDDDRNNVAKLVGVLRNTDLLTNEQFMKVFKALLSRLQTLENDLPMAKSHLASFASKAISCEAMMLIDFAALLTKGLHYPLFLLCLQQLLKNNGEEWLTCKFNDSNINLRVMLPKEFESDEKLMEVLEERSLSFLMPLQKVQTELWKFLGNTCETSDDTGPSAASLYKWLKDNVDNKLHSDSSFVSLFITSLLRFITLESTLPNDCDVSVIPDKTLINKEKQLLEKYKGVMQKLLLDNLDLHVTAIYALQVLSHQLHNPKGLLLRLFSSFYDMEVLYEEAFIRWKEELNDLQPGKGQALFQVNQWLVWLEQADEDSEEED